MSDSSRGVKRRAPTLSGAEGQELLMAMHAEANDKPKDQRLVRDTPLVATWDGSKHNGEFPLSMVAASFSAMESTPNCRGTAASSATGTGGDVDAEGKLHRPCASCRSARVLCDRGHPCQRCIRLNIAATCAAPPTVRRGRPPKGAAQARWEWVASSGLPSNSSIASAPVTRVLPTTVAEPVPEPDAPVAHASVSEPALQVPLPRPPSLSGIGATSTSPPPQLLDGAGSPVSAALSFALGLSSRAIDNVRVGEGMPSLASPALTSASLDERSDQHKIAALRKQLLELGIDPCV